MIIWLNHDTVSSVHDLHRLLIGDEVERRSRLTVLRDGRLNISGSRRERGARSQL